MEDPGAGLRRVLRETEDFLAEGLAVVVPVPEQSREEDADGEAHEALPAEDDGVVRVDVDAHDGRAEHHEPERREQGFE